MWIVRHAPTQANDPGSAKVRGWLDSPVDESGYKLADERAQHFMDIPLQRIQYSPVERSRVMAEAIQMYSGVQTMEPDYRLMSWNMGDFQGQDLDDVADSIDAYMRETPRIAIPGGESYVQFLSRLLPYIRESADQDELVCVTHFRDIVAVAAWDAAGRDGITQDPDVLSDIGPYDDWQIVLVTPDSFIPMVKDAVTSQGGS